jgi:hypothetical protein
MQIAPNGKVAAHLEGYLDMAEDTENEDSSFVREWINKRTVIGGNAE